MSGHSKWSTIKRKKGATDARRGKIFTKLIKEITVAARMGGGDPDANPRLRTAIAAAKAENMPKDNIERAIKKGTGELEGASYEEVCYEGYGPGGAAVLVESLTDNKKRTVADIRYIFSKSGGSLGEAGCVAWMFEKKGLFVFDKGDVDEERLMEAVLDAGAEDIRSEETTLEVITAPEDFESVKKALDQGNLPYLLGDITMVPKSTVKLEGKQAEQMLRLMDSLEDSDDVQKVHSNFDIADKTLEQIGRA
ncbi:MAG: YebC/PmpR family DNA-binding transcriptional regulator [Deltaproteobacteria bacterium]|nr:YebC/PmpR family DNA-binding transcriptional regulator [Deltaproteobacteria bacterium]MBW2019295.1 YebC/PmpR family DNA-binding transcriptional regulator [Deltaproteobacteria bacterium]MBW2074084.1 YebC/PmpR family DNA-binding transcriptional regulator [Deltaproteobacteria bacterium]